MAALLAGTAAFAQGLPGDGGTADWKVSSAGMGDNRIKLTFTGEIHDGWHIYPLDSDLYPTEIVFEDPEGYTLDGDAYAITIPGELNGHEVYFDEAVFAQNITLTSDKAAVKGYVTWMACTETQCSSPEYLNFSVNVKADTGAAVSGSSQKAKSDKKAAKTKSGKSANGVGAGIESGDGTAAGSGNGAEIRAAESPAKGKFNWGLVLEAILWGFAALLTPCVFPMVPMTVSFFIKGGANPAVGRFKALMYGVFIICLYTVPISVIILITRIAGGEAVTADIFNWLATHWIPNILFFIIFMVFAASFFGAFEITMPSRLVNSSDKNSDRKGLGGVFFMALTLVLVSFSCTGPIVGSVLIKATQGEFWEPMVAMLAFSIAFALPFTILAFFPSLLKNLPKSGGWLNSVKVVLGFIEVALGFKFLSVADQTYHWGLLDREVYLAIWIVVFTLLGFYLLGKIRFRNDDKVEHVSVLRLALSILVFAFVVYMVPGMFGAPLKALSGYLPPITTQDFVLGQPSAAIPSPGTHDAAEGTAALPADSEGSKYGLKLPLGLTGYFDLEEGLAAAGAVGKPVFVDITGHGCVNCREMESRVWSDPQVLEILRDDYIIVALYTDDKQKLEKEDWLITENGDVLTQLGRKNSYIARTRFGVNAQPNYVLLSPDGDPLAPVRGYNLDVKDFVKFLKSGLK